MSSSPPDATPERAGATMCDSWIFQVKKLKSALSYPKSLYRHLAAPLLGKKPDAGWLPPGPEQMDFGRGVRSTL
jgi:hypothetical protein